MKKYFRFVYKKYIQEDWTVITKLGRFFLKPAWLISSIIVGGLSIICFPLVLLHMYYGEEINKIILSMMVDFDEMMSDLDNMKIKLKKM